MLSRHVFTRAGIALTALNVLVAGCSPSTSTTPAPAATQAAKPASAAATQAPAAATQAPAANPAATTDKPKMSIMVGGLNKHIYLTATLAKQLGLYDAEGVDVTLFDEPAGASAETSMLSGEVQFAFGSYDHTIDLQGVKKSAVNVFTALIAPGEAEMVGTKAADTLKSPADFKDKNLGVTSIGSGTHLLTQFLSVKNGVPTDQIHPVAVGAGDTFIAAMQQGKIDAGMTTEPTISRLIKSGAGKVLVDLRTAETTRAALGGDYPFTCFYGETNWVNNNKPAVQKLVNALVKTHKWITSHSPEEITAMMPEDYYAGDKELYLTALKGEMGMYSPDGKMVKGGPEFILSVLQQFDDNVKDKPIDLSKTYTSEFVDKAN
ncbi:MAG: ABC transporter substrate-binding protein [Chloroflexota bacterium]